jgi:hypothetical protein
MMRTEAIACTRKYLMAASDAAWLGLEAKIGIKLMRLISRPSQAVTHEEADMAIKVPMPVKMRKRDI